MVYTVPNKTFSSNTYLLAAGDKCIVIDPGLDFGMIDQAITEHGLIPVAVISTHGHFDHIGSAQNLIDKYEIPFYLHKNDVKMVASANFFIKLVHLDHTIKTPRPTNILKEDSETLHFEGFEPIHIRNFEGHSNGSCVIQYKNLIFTGDMVYLNHMVANSFPGENLDKLRASIRQLFANYPPETIAYPGHGKSGTLAMIKKENKELAKFLDRNE